MPTPTSGHPSAFGSGIFALAVAGVVLAAFALALGSPAIRAHLSRILLGHHDEPNGDATKSDTESTAPRQDGAIPFSGFSADMYGPLPDPEPEPASPDDS